MKLVRHFQSDERWPVLILITLRDIDSSTVITNDKLTKPEEATLILRCTRSFSKS